MNDLNRLLSDNPQDREKKTSGWLPGIVVSLEDPLNLGRLKVVCPLIDPDKPLPNNHDGWVQMLNPSGGSGSPGGTQNLIQINDQVVLLPMLGDIKNCIALGVLHSQVDPPSEHFNRVEGVYGSHSPNGDIEVKDEKNRRSLKTLNGCTEVIDPSGNKTMVGPGGAGVHMGAEGEARIDNQSGVVGVSETGDVNLTNANADMCIGNNGQVDVTIKGTKSLSMSEAGTEVTGQKDKIAREVSEVREKALSPLSRFPVWRSQLQEIASEFKSELSFNERLNSLYILDEILEQMVEGVGQLVLADKPLAKLQSYEPLEFGTQVAGQLDKFRSGSLTELMEKYAGKTISGAVIDRLPAELEEILGGDVVSGIDTAKLQNTLTGLQHNPEEQIKALLESVVPLSEIDSIISKQLHTNLTRLNSFVRKVEDLSLDAELDKIDSFSESQSGSINKVLEQIKKISGIVPPFSPAATKTMVATIKGVTSQVRTQVESLKGQLKDAQAELTKIVDLKDNFDLEEEFGNTVVEHIGEATKCIGNIKPTQEKIASLESLTTLLLKLDGIDRIEEGAELYRILPQLEENFDLVKYDKLIVEEGVFVDFDERVGTIQQLIIDLTTDQIPAAIASLLLQIEADMVKGYQAVKGIDESISSNTTSGGIKIDDTGAKSETGAVGGQVVQDKTCAALVAPKGDRGLGSKIVAETDKAVIASAGAGTKLESKIEVSTEGIEMKAPGAELGLGTWFKMNQEQCYFWAPGAKDNQMGSTFFLNQDTIILSSAGGTDAGSSIQIQDDAIAVNAPGGDKGSGLVIDVDSAGLFSPGGRTNGGTSVQCEPEQLRLTLSGITGGNIFLKQNQIKSELPLMRSEISMRSNRIQIRSLMAKVDVTPTVVSLSVGGATVQILPGVVRLNGLILINNLPLTPGNFW